MEVSFHPSRRQPLYGLNGFVRHPLHQAMDVAFGTLPLVIAGLPVPVAAALGTAIAIQLNLQHANVNYAIGPLRKLLSIGPVHRLHHVNWAGDGDVNFGLFLTLWDRALGTFKPGSARAPRVADIGIQDCPHFPQNYARQLRIPFERGSPCEPGNRGLRHVRRRSRRDDLKRRTARGEARLAGG